MTKRFKLIDSEDLFKRMIGDIEKLMEEQKEVRIKIQALQEKQFRVYLTSEVEEAINQLMSM